MNMDGLVSFHQVLDYFLGFKRVSIRSKICFLLSFTCIGYTLKLAQVMRPSRLLASGAVLAAVLGSSQIFSLFSLALPQGGPDSFCLHLFSTTFHLSVKPELWVLCQFGQKSAWSDHLLLLEPPAVPALTRHCMLHHMK